MLPLPEVSAEDLARLSREELEEILLMLDEEERRRCEASYFEFFQVAWKVLEPQTTIKLNWHIKFLCDRLQREMERVGAREPRERDIIINVPFRSGKTRIVTELLHPWVWTRWPWMKFITWSYAADLATDKTVSSRRVIQSDWYQRNWGDRFSLSEDENLKTHFSNDKGGSRRATSTGGQVTGQGADVLIGDDPLNPKQADSEALRKECLEHYNKTMYSRLDDAKTGVRIIVMQRLHEEDLTGHLLQSDPESYEHICLPGELSDKVRPVEAREFYRDGLFDPFRFDRKQLAGYKKPLGSYGYAGQIMQAPSPAVGGMFKGYWWKFWVPKGVTLPAWREKNEKDEWVECQTLELPERFDEMGMWWDLNFGKEDGTEDEDLSFVVGEPWGRVGSRKFLLDQFREQTDFVGTVKAFEAMVKKWPQVYAKYVEKKANGAAMISSLTSKIPGIVPVPAENDKVTRARPASVQCEAGNLVLPHPALFPWVQEKIAEHKAFPKGKFDDQVDTTAHMANRWPDEAQDDVEEMQVNL
jgi:predicted phage terminase large subunit-like protein